MGKIGITNDENFRMTDAITKMRYGIRSREWVAGPFNSNAQIYVDAASVPSGNLSECFRDKVVVYVAFTEDGNAYAGYTVDFGQRMSTHCAGCKSEKANNVNHVFMKSVRKSGKMYVIPVEFRSFSTFKDGRDDAAKWGRRYTKLLKKRMALSGKTIANLKF